MNKKEIYAYESDASGLIGEPSKVVFPQTPEEISSLIKNSSEDIIPRGAGTNLVGGCVPNNSLIIDLSKMNKVLNFDKTKRVLYVEAGVTLKELNEKLNVLGFEFPIQPLNNGVSTLGGMIATNAFDSRAMKYGEMKNWIEEVDFINGRGELMKATKADLMDICGMEGITGIIIGAKIFVTPKVRRTASLFQTDNLEEALAMSRRLKLEDDVCMLDLFSRDVSKILGFPKKYHIIIEFNSERGKIKGKEYSQLMELRENTFYKLIKEGYHNIEDFKLFFDKLRDFVLYLESNQIPYYSNLGTGIVHPFFRDFEEIKRKEIIEVIKNMKGKPGKFGIGITRKYFIDSFEARIYERVKSRHDPFSKFNKGKIIRFEGGLFQRPIRKKEENKNFTTPLEKAEKILSKVEELEKITKKSKENDLKNKQIKPKTVKILKKEKINNPKEIPEINKLSNDLNNFYEKDKNNQYSEQNLISKSSKDNNLKKFNNRNEDTTPSEEIVEDYLETFNPNPTKEKIQNVENFAKKIPKIVLEKNNEKSRVSEPNKNNKKPSQIDINKIMTNNLKEKINENTEQNPKQNSKLSDEELIRKIMGNTYNDKK